MQPIVHSFGNVDFVPCFDAKELNALLTTQAEDVFEVLARRMASEPHLLHPEALALRRSFDESHACVLLSLFEGRYALAGYARLVPLADTEGASWYELGSVYINQSFLNHGVTTHMYKAFLERHKEKHILATTTNPAAVAVGKKLGFVTVYRKELPSTVWESSCTCSEQKMGTNNAAACSLAYGETNAGMPCFFRLTEGTFAKVGIKKVP